VILRLETIKELSDVMIDLKPALRLLRGVSKQLFEFLPDVSSELSKVNDAISETLYSTRMTADETLIPVNRKTPGGEEILKEERIADKLPEPPTTLENPEPAPVKQLIALATACSQAVGRRTVEENLGNSSQNLFAYKNAEIQEITLKVEKTSLEDALLEYAKKSKGEIDLTQCSLELDTSCEEIEKALESLGSKGKIKIETRVR